MIQWDWDKYKDVPADVRVCPVCGAVVLLIAIWMHEAWHVSKGDT